MNVCIAFGSRIVLINKPGTQKASQQPKPKHMYIDMVLQTQPVQSTGKGFLSKAKEPQRESKRPEPDGQWCIDKGCPDN